MIPYQVKTLDELLRLLSSNTSGNPWYCPYGCINDGNFNPSCNIECGVYRYNHDIEDKLREEIVSDCWKHFTAKLKTNNYDNLDRLMDYKKIMKESKIE